ncbi:MAG TPA: chromate resistance protein ChrB domain-containing protein [Polyangiaceae bacterium]|nr:chromate resistance protein ChrB domain-containing protein [Polyangiaceae bacterium]
MVEATARWLLLIHQIPPAPAYLRVKVGRRLARMGAVALKNSVYVLPRSDESVEDFQWVRREIVESGGDATIVEANLVDGLSDEQAEALFRRARAADYEAIESQARALGKGLRGKLSKDEREAFEADIVRIERRFSEIDAIDFFRAPGAERAAAALRDLRARLDPPSAPSKSAVVSRESYRGRVWVTRSGIHVDRIASAWLIRRFIDPDATFKFVPAKGYVVLPNELRFDMFEAEFSHEGELCTFEVLCRRLALEVPGLQALAQVIHDIDLKDLKYARPETDGVAALIAGIALRYRDDDARLAHGSELCEQLLAYYARKKEETVVRQARTVKKAGKK